MDEAQKLRKAQLLAYYSHALDEIAKLQTQVEALKPKARPVPQPVSGLITVTPFTLIECPEHGKSRANKLGHCCHCYNRARGKPEAQ
jgi:hypothetical protein